MLATLLLASALSSAQAPPLARADVPSVAAPEATVGQAELQQQLAAAVRAAGLGDGIGVAIVDLRTQATVLSHNADKPLNPASNMKLLTAAAGLIELGSEFRMNTGLYGRVFDGAVLGGLCLKGRGDPTLQRSDLMLFAQRAAEEGVRQVDQVTVDGTYFDGEFLPPLFEQQPNEIAPFRAAVAALSVKANAYTLRIRPGLAEGALARVSVDGSGYFQLDNTLLTSASGAASVIADDRATPDGVVLSLRGSVPLGSGALAYERRVPAPLQFAGHVFIDAMRSAGISAPKRVQVGTCAPDLPLIYVQQSPPLGQILARLGKDSDNFVAEMVLKVLGAEREHRPGTSSAGASVVVDIMKQLSIPTEGMTIRNGSGLFQGNLVTANQIASLLAAMYANPAVRDDYLSHLAIGGVDGTLARRFRKLPQPRIVRAKTGTLNDTIALSGYVLGPTPERVFAFSYLANQVAGKHSQARGLIDQIVEQLAAHLYGAPKPAK